MYHRLISNRSYEICILGFLMQTLYKPSVDIGHWTWNGEHGRVVEYFDLIVSNRQQLSIACVFFFSRQCLSGSRLSQGRSEGAFTQKLCGQEHLKIGQKRRSLELFEQFPKKA